MTSDILLVEAPAEGVVRLVLNRPDRLNAITDQLELELDSALVEAERDETVRVVILTGSGDRAFSTGYDLYEYAAATRPELDDGPGPYLGWQYERQDRHRNCLLRLWNLAKPVIAAVNGHAIAAGAELAMICDITIASENAMIGEPEIRHVSAPPTLIMPWIIGWKQSKRLLFTGDSISAAEAYRLGLYTAVVPQAELQEQAVMLAERIARVPRMALKYQKLAINRAVEIMGLREALEANTAFSVLGHEAFGREEGNRAELEEGREREGLRGFLKVRDDWFTDQQKDLKV